MFFWSFTSVIKSILYCIDSRCDRQRFRPYYSVGTNFFALLNRLIMVL